MKIYSLSSAIVVVLILFSNARAEFKLEPNGLFTDYLHNEELYFEPLRVGDKVPLHSLIVMPAALGRGNGILTLEFKRTDFSEEFIRKFFIENDPMVLGAHPFSSLQMESKLKSDCVVIVIHDGVFWHLRSDTKDLTELNTFNNPDTVANVVDVQGDVLYSKDHHLIKNNLQDFEISVSIFSGENAGNEVSYGNDGSIIIWQPLSGEEYPRIYKPLVEMETKK